MIKMVLNNERKRIVLRIERLIDLPKAEEYERLFFMLSPLYLCLYVIFWKDNLNVYIWELEAMSI